MTRFARGRNLLGSRIAKNAAAVFVVQMSAYAAPLLVRPYLSRVLSTDHFGLIAFATTFNFYFITLVEYGFNLTATRRIAIHANDPEKVARITWSVYAAKALLTVLGFLIMITVVLAIPKFRKDMLMICIGYLAVIGDLLFPIWLFQGLQKMENLVWRDLCAKLVSLALVFAFVHKDGDYLLAQIFQAGSTVIAGIIGLITVPFVLKTRWVPPTWEETRTALVEGWPVFMSMVSFTLTSASSIVFLQLRAGPTEVAYFMASYGLVVALRALVDPVKTAIYPHISHMASRSKQDAVVFLRKYGLLLTSPFLAGSIVLLVLSPFVIHLLYGAKYTPAIPVLRVLAFSPFLLALQHNYSTFFMLAFGYERQWSKIILYSAVLYFIVLIALLYLLWPPIAVALTGIILDVFVTAVTYRSIESIPSRSSPSWRWPKAAITMEPKAVRVLLVAPSLAITGGQSVQAAKLLEILAPLQQIEMRFFPIDPPVPGWLQWARRLPVVRTLLMFLLYVGGLIQRVPQTDVLHVFTAGLSSFTLWTIPALVLSRLFGKKFLMHYHDGQAEQHLTEWRSASPTIALADRLIVPSGFLVDAFHKHGIEAQVISNIVELDRFTYRPRGVLRPIFMTNRMLEPLYNIPCILHAFRIIQDRYPDAQLTIAHDGHSRLTLEDLARELQLRHVSFIGRVAYDAIPTLYDDADIYIMTPNIDNMPGSVLECFSSGLPVIATKAGGVPYIAEDRRTALLVDLDDHQAVARCAIELLENPHLAANLTEQAQGEVQQYHWKPVRDRWAATYLELAAERRRLRQDEFKALK